MMTYLSKISISLLLKIKEIMKTAFKSDKSNDIYSIIQQDYECFAKSDHFKNDGFDMAIWSMDYSENMPDETKEEIFEKYGNRKINSMLPKIARLNNYRTYEDMADYLGEKECDIRIIAFIIVDDILLSYQ